MGAEASTQVLKLAWVFFLNTLLAISNNTIYKLMSWLYKVRHGAIYFYDVVGYSSSDVTSGALLVEKPAS